MTYKLLIICTFLTACQAPVVLNQTQVSEFTVQDRVHPMIKSLATPPPLEADLSPTAEILRLTNLERASAGLPLLSPQALLNQVALKHAQSMAATGHFSHVIKGLGPADRVAESPYRWNTVGENIAYGYTENEAVMKGWMDSSGHRANILSISFTELGIGFAKDSKGLTYWVQVFAKPQ